MMSDNKTTTLYAQAENDSSLETALNKAKESELLKGSIGLFYSPRSCAVGRMNANGEIDTLRKVQHGWELASLDLSAVFEVRLFTKTAEFSWLNDPTGIGGRAVLVTPTKLEIQIFEQPLENVKPEGNCYSSLLQSYLVWGEYDSDTERVSEKDWTIVSTSQIGQLAIPIAPTPRRDFVVLKTQEYLTTDEHGNAYVKYERLLNLSWESKETKQGG